jgi:translocation and assembly module TamB
MKPLLLKVAAFVAGALVLLVFAALLVVQSQWFQNYVKEKIISTVEDSTGGKVAIGSFHFDPWSLTARITDFTLHGTEAPNLDPLAHITLLELHLKLFSGLKKTVDLAYLGVNDPKVNLIVNADGTTNIPSPKVKTPPSQTSGLETVVDLAVGQFRINNGVLLYSQKSSSFAAQGSNLRVMLDYNSFNFSYGGRVLIDPLLLTYGKNPPLKVQVNLPVMLEKDAVSISGGQLTTPLSQISVNAGLRDLKSPKITARVNANLALAEMPIGMTDSKQHLTADLNAAYDDATSTVQLQTAQLVLGQSTLEASGTDQAIQFKGKFALAELSRIFKMQDNLVSGVMQLQGHAHLDAQQKLSVDSNLTNLSVASSGYSAVVGGVINAQEDLKAKGTTGLAAQARLTIAPGRIGVPVTGTIDGQFVGASNTIRLNSSYIALPHSRVDLSGDINKQLNASLVSHNLSDFAPLTGTIPVALQGGTARVTAQVKGDLSAPQIQAHAAVDHFVVRDSQFQQASLDLAASPSGAAVKNGSISGSGLHSNFEGSIALYKWKPLPRSALAVNLTLAGQKDPFTSGKVNAETHIAGTYGDPQGNANFQILNGVVSGQPFSKVQGNTDLANKQVTLTSLEVDAAGGQVLAHGSFGIQSEHADFHVTGNGIQLAQVQPLQEKSPGAAGTLKLTADGSGDIRNGEFALANINSDFSATGLKVNNQAAGDLTANARTANGNVIYNVNSNFAGSAIQVNGTTSLKKDYPTQATTSIKNLPLEKALAIAGEGAIPVQGLFSASGTVSGTMANPEALLDLSLTKAVVYQEPLNDLATHLHYTSTLIDISNFSVSAPAGKLNAAATFNHADNDFKNGQIQLHLTGGQVDLAKVKQLTLAGAVKFNADVAGSLKNGDVLLSDANADVNATGLRDGDLDVGDVKATARTQQHVVKYEVDSNFSNGALKAIGQTELSSTYPTHAKFTFAHLKYAQAPVTAQVDGEAIVDGPVTDLNALTGRLQLNQLTVDSGAHNRHVHVAMDEPAIVTLNHSIVSVQHFKLQDGKSFIQAQGGLSLKDSDNPLSLKLLGNTDLGILEDADRDFYSSGNAILDATIHGSLSKPLVNGKVELQNAAVNYAEFSNGISKGNGVILLNGSNATIQNLTGESGGGKISLTGFAGFTPTSVVFNLRATANKVRTRYADASVTSNADISLAGNTQRSTLSGTVTIQRISYSTSSDVGSFLTSASAPPSTPSAPSPFLSGMRLDLRIITATDMRVVSTYSDKLALTSSLTLSGTAQDPGILGRVNVTNGDLVFFGNTYTVNNGSINFYNPNSIQPILDLSLETTAQGVDVTLGVSGPVDNLKLSYRSDPPLSFEQIVQLLATNTTPNDPTIAAHQPAPAQQSASQMGESAVLGQAVANPLASRVQRVFGLTQFKIDPSVSGSNGQPSARVTLQQKITSNLTFTYITDVTQTNSEIIRVTLDITPRIAAVALRDYNGNVSVELFYKFQKR